MQNSEILIIFLTLLLIFMPKKTENNSQTRFLFKNVSVKVYDQIDGVTTVPPWSRTCACNLFMEHHKNKSG